MASNGPEEAVQDSPRLPTPIDDYDDELFVNNDGYDADGNGADGSRPDSLFGGNSSDSDHSDVPMPDGGANAGGDNDSDENDASGGDGDPRESFSEPGAAGGGGSGGGDSSGDSSRESDSGDDSEDSSDGSDDEDSDDDSDAPNGAAGSARVRRPAPIPPPLAGAAHFECNRTRDILLADRDHYLHELIQFKEERNALVNQVRDLATKNALLTEKLRNKVNGHTERTWQDMLRPWLGGGQPNAAYRKAYDQCCKEENMSMKLTRRHPDIVFVAPEEASDSCRDRFSADRAPGQGEQSFAFARLPPDVKVKIFKLWLFKDKLVHCFSRLDRFKPPTNFPSAEDLVVRNSDPPVRRSGLPRGFYWGDRECSLTLDCRRPSDVLRLLLVSQEFNFIGVHCFYGMNTFAFSSLGEFYRFGKGIGLSRLARIQHIELTWLGSQYLTAKVPAGKTKRPYSVRTNALYWLQECTRLRTLVVHINESAKMHMRRAYEPASLVNFMKWKTNGQPNQRKTRSMRTVQAMDCVYQLRGMNFIHFYDLECSANSDTGERVPIRDWSFTEDVNNTGGMQKVPTRLEASKLENLPRLAPQTAARPIWNPSRRLFEALSALYAEANAWDESREAQREVSSDSDDSDLASGSDSGSETSDASSSSSSSGSGDSGDSWDRVFRGQEFDSLFDEESDGASEAESALSRLPSGNSNSSVSDPDSDGSGLFVNQGVSEPMKEEPDDEKDSNLDFDSSDGDDSDSETPGSSHTPTEVIDIDSDSDASTWDIGSSEVATYGSSEVIDVSSDSDASDSDNGDPKSENRSSRRTTSQEVINIDSDTSDSDSVTEVPGSYGIISPAVDVDALPVDPPPSFADRQVAIRSVYGTTPSSNPHRSATSLSSGLFVSPNPDSVISTPEPDLAPHRCASILARRSDTRESSGLFVSPRPQTHSVSSTPQPSHTSQASSQPIDLTRETPDNDDDDDDARASTPPKHHHPGASTSASPAPKRQRTRSPSPPGPAGV